MQGDMVIVLLTVVGTVARMAVAGRAARMAGMAEAAHMVAAGIVARTAVEVDS